MSEINATQSSRFDRSNLFRFGFFGLLAVVLCGLMLAGQVLLVFAGVIALTFIVCMTLNPRVGTIALIFTCTSLLVPTGTYYTHLPFGLTNAINLATAIGFIVWSYNHKQQVTYAPQMLWLMVFLATVCFSVIVQPDLKESLTGLVKIIQCIGLYLMIASLAADPKWIRIFCYAVTATAVVASCIAIAEHYLPSLHVKANDPRLQEGIIGAIIDEDSADSGEIARVTGGIGDANYLAYTLAAAMPLGVYLWKATKSNRVRLVIVILTMLQLMGLAFSYTRTGFLGLAVAAVYLLIRKRLPIGPFLFISFAAMVSAVFILPPSFFERMFSSRYLQEGSTPVRRDYIYTALELVQERPVLGFGYGQFGPEFVKKLYAGRTLHEFQGGSGKIMEEVLDKGYEAVRDIRCHNTYLEVLLEYGLIGLIPYLIFLGWVARDLWKAERATATAYSDLASCLMAGLFSFFICAFFAHSKILPIFWILAGIACALRRIIYLETKQSEEATA